jgi:SAM-dependent methyltransferase
MSAATRTQSYFDRQAASFDRAYARSSMPPLMRRGPWRSRELAVAVVAEHDAPAVLDVGCGPGRVAEAVLDAGAARYVGIDFSPPMLALARERLAGLPSVELVEGDFLEADVGGAFDVVLALGLFDYLEEPERAAAWMRARCGSTLVASFTRWDWLKGPLRHVYYELLNRCPIRNYTETGVEAMLTAAGFARVEFPFRGSHGFLARGSVR